MDLHAHSAMLLERLANSIHERESNEYADFTFTIKEIHIVEKWMREALKDSDTENGKTAPESAELHHETN